MTPLTLYKCLSDETRLVCTQLIFLENELCVCELMEAMSLSQPKISRHLAQLRECGVLRDRRQERWVFYQLSTELPQWAAEHIESAAQADALRLKTLRQKLQTMKHRPQRCQ
ncbi:transcriptional regulator, ArsR family [Alteromonadaceae bacterium Bs31]|nr:transcriptional regulator, ArsR family [Alteromonadaceae bacterium Bs31]